MRKIMVIFLLALMLFSLVSCSSNNSSKIENNTGSATPADSEAAKPESEESSISSQAGKRMDWPEITENGVNEELLIENIDVPTLEKVAAEFQALVQETIDEEHQNPEIVITKGFPRVFKTERYKKVLSMGEIAMKPLYFIIYKSEYAGMYEYICARALCDLSGADFDWSNSKEFLENFNCMILENRQQSL